MAADEMWPLLAQDRTLILREIVDAMDKMEAQPRVVLQNRMRQWWKIQAAESEAAATVTDRGGALNQEEAEEDLVPPPVDRVGPVVYDLQPGAYRVCPGQAVRKATDDEDRSFKASARPSAAPLLNAEGSGARAFLEEANLAT
jgi:hypothetical protein